uniref:F-box domain-containing protein n=1 Tax=Leersia perrieri TaxID=77586 RepID=A0A0D9VMX2_9ORYZ
MKPCSVDNRKGHPNDRLSKLPDDLLLSILDRLNVRDAARTSLLSRRWRHLPAMLSRLMIDFGDFLPNGRLTILSEDDLVRINAVVVQATKSILERRNPNECTIQQLCMVFFLTENDYISIGRAVEQAIATSKIDMAEFTILTEKFHTQCSDGDFVNYGRQFAFFFDSCPDAFGGLTRLNLGNMRFGDRTSPTSSRVVKSYGIYVCLTAIQELGPSCKSNTHNSMCSVFPSVVFKLIWLPELTTLIFEDWISFEDPLTFGYVPLLEAVRLTNVGLSWHKMVSLSKFLGKTHVRDLTLDFKSEKIWVQPEVPQRLASSFYKLRFVNLFRVPEGCDLTWTMFILEAAPHLKELYMTVWDHLCDMETDEGNRRALSYCEEKTIEWPVSAIDDFKHQNLAVLTIFGFQSEEYMVMYVKHVMEVAVNLEDVFLYNSNKLACVKCSSNNPVKQTKYPWTKRQRCSLKKRINQGTSFAILHFPAAIRDDHTARLKIIEGEKLWKAVARAMATNKLDSAEFTILTTYKLHRYTPTLSEPASFLHLRHMLSHFQISVKSFVPDDGYIWVQPECPKLLAPVLQNLQVLNLDELPEGCDIAWTNFFLEAAPALKEVCITVWDHWCEIETDKEEREEQGYCDKINMECKSSAPDGFRHYNLTKLTIHGFQPDENFMGYIRHTMEAAVNLEEISLYDRKVLECCEDLDPNIKISQSMYPQTVEEQELVRKQITEGLVMASPDIWVQPECLKLLAPVLQNLQQDLAHLNYPAMKNKKGSHRNHNKSVPFMVDRFTKLPDDILLNILNRLNTSNAVRTCLLSKRIAHLRHILSHFQIRVDSFLPDHGYDTFKNTINNVVADATETVLTFRSQEIPLHKLTVCFYLKYYNCLTIGKAVAQAMATNKLDSAEFIILTEMGQDCYTSYGLRHNGMQLMRFFNACTDAFAGLTRLDLHNLRLDETDILKILDTCKFLEYLHLSYCQIQEKDVLQLPVLKVEHTRLVEFHMLNACLEVVELNSVPNLKRLVYNTWKLT